jgi:hypothetical protein
MPLHPPPKRHNLPLYWGEGVAGLDLAQKGSAGDAIIMRWTMTMMTTKTMAHSNIIYSITTFHTNK